MNQKEREVSERFWFRDSDSDEYYVYKKIIPKDICLTPGCVANWYMGDGNISKSRNQINLATTGFLKDDVVFISDLLSEVVGVNCFVTKKNCIELYNKYNVSTFLNYIKVYRVNCYDYKFPVRMMNNVSEKKV